MDCAARRLAAPVALLGLLLWGAGRPDDNPAAAFAAQPAGRHHLHAESTVAHDGRTERLSLDVDGPARLERSCRADLCTGSWFDGRQSAEFGLNGTAFPDARADDLAARTFGAIASTAFAGPEFITGGGRVSRLPAPAGAAAVRFRVRAPGGSELVAVGDPATRRLLAVERTDGTLLAALVASGTPPALVYATRGYDRVSTATEPLAAPAGPAVSGSGGRDEPLGPGPLPIVPCRLAGLPASCLIDSGTTPSAITLAFAERLGREPHGTIEIAAMGRYLTGIVDAGPLELGGLRIENLHFAVVPHVRGPAFDAIVGSDVLGSLRVEFEPRRRRARIASDANDSAGDGALPLRFEDGLPYLDVRLAPSRPPDSLLVDSGDSGVISIGYDAYREDPALFAPAGHVDANGLGSAAMDALSGELAELPLGSRSFERVPIVAVRGEHRGHLGYGIAALCGRYVLDLGHGRIICGPEIGAHSNRSPGQN